MRMWYKTTPGSIKFELILQRMVGRQEYSEHVDNFCHDPFAYNCCCTCTVIDDRDNSLLFFAWKVESCLSFSVPGRIGCGIFYCKVKQYMKVDFMSLSQT